MTLDMNRNGKNLWIGASRDENGTWTWVTGEPWEYTNWNDGEPNNSSNVVANETCAAVWPYGWNDLANDNLYEQSGYICEWDGNGEAVNIGENTLVTDAFNGGFSYASDFGVSMDYTIEIPKINLGGDEIAELNQNLYNTLYALYEESSSAELPESGNILYRWAVKDDVLSLVVRTEIPFTEAIFYDVYNIGISERKVLTKEETLFHAGLTTDEYENLLTEWLEDMFERVRNNGYPVDQYKEYDSQNFTKENMEESAPFFNRDGDLCAVCHIYMAAGVGEYYDIVNLETGETYPLFSLDTEANVPDTANDGNTVPAMDSGVVKRGVYVSSQLLEGTLTIHQVDGNTAIFSVYWPRMGSIWKAEVAFEGSIGNFYYVDTSSGYHAGGQLRKNEDGTLTIELTDSDLPDRLSGTTDLFVLDESREVED